jgi:hypothetical protein
MHHINCPVMPYLIDLGKGGSRWEGRPAQGGLPAIGPHVTHAGQHPAICLTNGLAASPAPCMSGCGERCQCVLCLVCPKYHV